MESMTGYSFIEKSTEQFTFSIEIKTLNSKYLEVYTNIPKILKSEDNAITNLLKKSFERGKVECTIDIYDWVESRPVHIDTNVLLKYYKEIHSSLAKLKIPANFSIDALLQLDGVVHKERTVLSKKSKEDIYNTLEKSIELAIKMRQKEGKSIKKDLELSLKVIENACNDIQKLANTVVEYQFKRLKKALESLLHSKVDDNRIYTEIAILADKQDINEELSRLKDHMQKFKDILLSEGQKGRQLDFLAQEMFREINTIGSKSNNAYIAHKVVEVKNHIDKIREQCRNIV
ncbi:MAG: YicC family protein [Spirochaetes bacterium]|nr:YicC family protein [Spirochaetota bacterium]